MTERMNELSPEEQELLREQGASLDSLREHHVDCPRPEVLMASQSGALPEETAQSVSRHVEKCAFCQILLKDMASDEFAQATVGEAQRVRARVFAQVGPRTNAAKAGGGFFAIWFWKALPITALAAAAIIAFVIWTRIHQSVSTVPGPAPVAQQQAPSATPSALVWEKLPIRLQASTILVVRGAPRTSQEKYAAALTSALAHYRDEKYPEAEQELAKVAKEFPRGVEGQLYLGVTQLALQKNAEAIAPLSAAQKLGTEQFRDDATWYLALAYRSSGDTQGALAQLQKLCQGKDSYTERACTGIRELGDKPVESH